MLGNMTGWHLLIILAVILLLFGAAKLPALARSLGQSARVFRGELKEMKREDAAEAAVRQPDAGEPGRTSDVSSDAAGGTSDAKP